jgi:hypothetical protein
MRDEMISYFIKLTGINSKKVEIFFFYSKILQNQISQELMSNVWEKLNFTF